ncbi:MAG: hypothetical protein GPJ25_11355 [Microcystis aeruginosa LE13-04]|nr:hypothetical protein [Microcystis aeruginosa LE13-04]
MKKRSKQRPRKEGNPDLRRQCQSPVLEIPQMVEELTQYLTPTSFTPLKYLQGNHDKLMRDRLLNLPVMVPLVLRLVYRKIAGLSEAVRVLKEEGLLWVKPLEVSKQAVSKRLMNLPCEIWRVLLKQVLEKSNLKPQNLKLEARWQRVSPKISAIWIADGSTL